MEQENIVMIITCISKSSKKLSYGHNKILNSTG